jgi:hypothetical protein
MTIAKGKEFEFHCPALLLTISMTVFLLIPTLRAISR